MKRDVWALELAKRWKDTEDRTSARKSGDLPAAASDQAKRRDNGEGRAIQRIQDALALAS